MQEEYYGHPSRHDFIQSTIARNPERFNKIFTDKIQFLKNYQIRRVEIELPVWKRMARKYKYYSHKTIPEPDGKIDLVFLLDGFGDKEGKSRTLCFEIKDGTFNFEKDILKYRDMETMWFNLPVIPLDSSEDPLIVIAWEEEILRATDNNPDSIERDLHWKVRFISLEPFYELIKENYMEVGKGIV